MTKIVAVHGIAQQGKGPNWVHDDWYKALCDGLRYSNITAAASDLVCPAYGDLFRRQLIMGLGEDEFDESELTEHDIELVKLVWAEAARIDRENVFAPDAQTMPLHHPIGPNAFDPISHPLRLT